MACAEVVRQVHAELHCQASTCCCCIMRLALNRQLNMAVKTAYLEGQSAASVVVARLGERQQHGGGLAIVVSRLEHRDRAVKPGPGRHHKLAAGAAVGKLACVEQQPACLADTSRVLYCIRGQRVASACWTLL